MNSSKNSPATRNCYSFLSVVAKSRVRVVALFILAAMIATAGVSAASSAGSLNKIIFGSSSKSDAANRRGRATKAVALDAVLANPAAAADTSASLLSARQGHTATSLENGKVLIVGGDAAGSAEVFDGAAGTSAVTGSLSIPRFDHTATKLSDGRVIVIGGRSGGTAVASTEIYNTTSGAFEAGPSMGVARAGHSATLLSDGRVLVAGGDAAGSAEIYDPASNSFAAAGALNDARTGHSAALLQDGRVLIVGGEGLSSGEIFDPSKPSFVGVGGMTEARVRPLLRVLFDGKVQIIGGNANRSMEIYDPAQGIFGGYAQVPPDGDLHSSLITEIMSSPTRAAILNNGQTISELPAQIEALAAGGTDGSGSPTNAATIYGSSPASVSSDKIDYLPDTQVIITGRGFQPNETIDLTFHEYPHVDTAELHTFKLQADADGNFTFDQYSPEAADLGITYILGAKGESSGSTAQTTFHDNVTVTPASGGTNISADKAANATSPAFTTLGDIVIAEAASNDFAAQTNTTLILTAPGGWQFNAGVGTTSTTKSGAGANELSVNSISVASSTITVNITVTGVGQINTLSIKGIQVRATDGANLPASGNIFRATSNAGNATIAGIVATSNADGSGTGVTNFGSLSQVVGAVSKLVVTLPGQTFTDGSTVATSGNTGTPTAQTAGTSFNIPNLRAVDQFFNVVTSYTGAKTISYAGPGTNSGFAAPSYTTSVNFTNGVSTTTLATTLTKAETTTITASDAVTPLSGIASSSITVNASTTLSSFAVTDTSGSNIGTQTAGTPFNIKVRAVDAGGNTITSFSGGSNKVMINPSSGTLSAGGGTSDAFTNGVLSTWSVTFSTSGTYPGSFNLIANGIGGNSSITGTSNSFTVNAPPCTTPSVTTQPTNQTVAFGVASVSFTSAASGTPAPTVQWQSSPNGTTWTNIGGATSTTLTINSPTAAQSGTQYRAVFTNSCGSVNSNAATLTVNKADPAITWNNPADITYPATLSATQLNATADVPGSFVYNPASGTVLNAGNAQTLSTTFTPTDTANYNTATKNVSINVLKASSTTTVTVSNATYDGTPHGGTASVTGAGGFSQSLTVSYVGRNGTLYPSSTIAPTNAGDYTASASFTGDANHNSSSDSKDYTINKANQTITFGVLGGKIFGDAPFTVSATGGGSGNPVTFSAGPAGVCSSGGTNGSTIAINGAGVCTVTASQAGNSNYNAASDVPQSFNVAKASSTTTVTVSNAAYDGNPHGGTASVTGAGSLSQTLTVTYAGRNATTYGPSTTAPTNAGDYAASASFAGDSNHDGSSDSKGFTINKAASTTTVTASDATYDGSSHGGTASVTGDGGLNQSLTVSYSGRNATTYGPSNTAPTNAGDYTASANFGGDSNHTNSSDSKNFSIAKASSTTTLTVSDATYDGNPHGGTASVTGTGGLSQSMTVSYVGRNGTSYGPSSTAPTNAGDYTASANFDGDANHNGSSDSKDFSINKASSTTVVTCPTSETYTGAAIEPCTASVSGAGGLSQSLSVSYSDNVSAGTAHASATYGGDANHDGSSDGKSFEITKAPSTTVVTCPPSVTYTGAALEPCTASVTGVGGLSQSLTVGYSGNVNAGTATASANYGGDSNHDGSSDSKNFEIAKAGSTVTVNCPGTAQSYTGAAITPCTAEATGVGMSPVDVSASLSYVNNVNVGTATAHASWIGDANHDGNTGSSSFEISKAPSTTTVICPSAAQTYTGVAIEPCTASFSGVGGLSGTLTPSYSNNVNVGTATASANYDGDANHDGSSNSANFEIGKAPSSVTVTCPGASQTYTGSAITPCTAEATGTGMSPVDVSASLVYANNVNVGPATASASWSGDANHTGSNGSGGFSIGKASSTVTVNCPSAAQTYNGSPQTPCTAQATGVGMSPVDVSASLVYTNNTNVGTAGASASWDGDANHTGSTGDGSFSIGKASSTTVVTVGNATYDGQPHGGTASVTGAGDLNQNLTVSYTGRNGTTYGPSTTAPTSAGDYTASASFGGDANHDGSSDSKNFSIGKATPTINWNNPADIVYGTLLGGAQLNATASYNSANVPGTFTYTPASGTKLNAGSGQNLKVDFAPNDTTDFNGASKTVQINVTKATLTIKADDKFMIFGGATPTFTATDSGYASGESRSNLSGTLTFTVKDGSNNPVTVSSATPVGTYTIIPSGLTSDNYNITFVNGTLAVSRWTLTGFYQPVDMTTTSVLVFNTVKGGSTVPLKFNIYAGTPGPTTERKSVSDVKSFLYAQIPCNANAAVDATLEVTTTGGTSLRYDTTAGQFIQNWQTPKPAGICYQVRMTAQDGSYLDAFFKTK